MRTRSAGQYDDSGRGLLLAEAPTGRLRVEPAVLSAKPWAKLDVRQAS
ncbi:hypothetical protein SFR_1097 [Streptomyces sp. FR-008]|nr:hypothetical protein SFR_1097 [Streptomyces sp. FR-008]